MKKATLAIFSLLTLGLLIGGAVHDQLFTEWRYWQKEYKKILKAKKSIGDFEIQPRQIVIPGLGELGTVDRCVSCHVGIDDPRMADQPQPFTAHPGNYLAQHDMDKFGCTACHGGQGRALTKEKAHESLLPAPFNQSTCGVCHDSAHLKESGAPVLDRGLEVFQTSGCLSCHKLGQRGGTL